MKFNGFPITGVNITVDGKEVKQGRPINPFESLFYYFIIY
jgi:hypothetical protein